MVYPRDSVLSQTLPQLWHLSDDESEALWQAFESLPLASLARSANVGSGLVSPFLTPEDDIELVLTAPTRYLMPLFDGPDAFENVLESLRIEVSLTIGREVDVDTRSRVEPIVEHVPPGLARLPLRAVRLSGALADFCQTSGMTDLGALQGVTEGQVLAGCGFGIDGLEALAHCYALAATLDGSPEASQSPPGEASLQTIVRRALVCGIRAPDRANRAYDVHLYRLGLLTGKRETHRAIGNLMGLTGARIDQIEKRSLRGFDATAFLQALLPLRAAMGACLLASGGASSAHDLAEEIARSMELSEVPPETAVCALAAILPDCEVAPGSEVVVAAGLPCLNCSIVSTGARRNRVRRLCRSARGRGCAGCIGLPESDK